MGPDGRTAMVSLLGLLASFVPDPGTFGTWTGWQYCLHTDPPLLPEAAKRVRVLFRSTSRNLVDFGLLHLLLVADSL